MTNDVNLCEAATTVTFVRRRKNIINLGSSFLQIDINSFRLAAPSERTAEIFVTLCCRLQSVIVG